jgi:hypothetical protein
LRSYLNWLNNTLHHTKQESWILIKPRGCSTSLEARRCAWSDKVDLAKDHD